MKRQNNIHDIDVAIRNILSRITPVNDNTPQADDVAMSTSSVKNFGKPCENSIRIVGDHNIIISSSIIPLALFFLSLLTLLSTLKY